MSLQGDLAVGEQEDLSIVNWLRKRITEWRSGAITGIPYDGASAVTKELLAFYLLCLQNGDRNRENDCHGDVSAWLILNRVASPTDDRFSYRKNGVPSTYISDFIVELDIGLTLIIETKGQYNDNADIKAKVAERWVDAVNQSGNFGLWQYAVVKDPAELPAILNDVCVSKWDTPNLEFGN
ncbi:hypothetical protein [Methylotuvimicrobium sp.]|uniref:hypothetical protein n=1 Tax=Methylotuvimicrobium sp. TaxID=2822413 RepID=UPI003D65F018